MIRKIVIGRDPKDAMAYYIGMRAGAGKVSAILLDEPHLHKYGSKRYIIYIENDEGTMVWKTVDGMPCIIEYDLKFE
tara:strand:- start:1300 stop:1530 length:231 start_codon:yes stop_codon:yes gene_type:complete